MECPKSNHCLEFCCSQPAMHTQACPALVRLLQNLHRVRMLGRSSLPHHCCHSARPGEYNNTCLPWLVRSSTVPSQGTGGLASRAWKKKEQCCGGGVSPTCVPNSLEAKMPEGWWRNVKLCSCEGRPQNWHRVTYGQGAAANTLPPSNTIYSVSTQLMLLTPKAGHLL